ELGDLGLETVDLGLELRDLRGLGLGRVVLALQRVQLLERGFAFLCLVGAGLAQLLDVHSHGSMTPVVEIAWTEKKPAFPLSRRWRGSSNSKTRGKCVDVRLLSALRKYGDQSEHQCSRPKRTCARKSSARNALLNDSNQTENVSDRQKPQTLAA